jgi:hypothetical protein
VAKKAPAQIIPYSIQCMFLGIHKPWFSFDIGEVGAQTDNRTK